MELKPDVTDANAVFVILLIVPYGIETLHRFSL